MIRGFLSLIILVITPTSLIAAVRIDSLRVDEDSSYLLVWGKLGPRGTITVQNYPLPIIYWSDTMLIATLPDTGYGSSGEVLVTDANNQSDSATLSEITGHYGSTEGFINIHIDDYTTYDFSFHFRFHFGTESRSLEGLRPNRIRSLRSFSRRDTGTGPWTNPVFSSDTLYHTTSDSVSIFYIETVPHDSHLKSWYLSARASPNTPVPSFDLSLDSSYVVVPHSPHGHPTMLSGGYWFDTALSGSLSYPPSKEFQVLQQPPFLISPVNGSTIAHTQLLWQNKNLIDSFQVQISTMALFDSAISICTGDTQLTLANLSQDSTYFWRVRGMNREGYSDWSLVRSFTVRSSGIAHGNFETYRSSDIELRGQNDVNIPHESCSEMTFEVYDMLGRCVRTASNKFYEPNPIHIDASILCGGMYYYKLRSAGSIYTGRLLVQK